MLLAGIQGQFAGLHLWIPDQVRYDKKVLVILIPDTGAVLILRRESRAFFRISDIVKILRSDRAI
jgi:hypothetical protein